MAALSSLTTGNNDLNTAAEVRRGQAQRSTMESRKRLLVDCCRKEKLIRHWIEYPPELRDSPEIRSGFFILPQARAVLATTLFLRWALDGFKRRQTPSRVAFAKLSEKAA
jgi:hypothetical protein